MDKVKISGRQALWLISMTVLSTNILFLPSLTAQTAGRDAWMTPLVATFTGAVLVYITVKLAMRFPDKNLIEYLPVATGKYLGKFIGFLYLLFFFFITGTIARESIGFVATAILPDTPPVVMLGIMMLSVAFAVRYGIEVISRMNDFIWIIFFISVILIIVLVFKEGDINNITPFFDNGIWPVIKGAFAPTAFRGEICLFLLMLAPVINEPREIGLRGFQSLIVIGAVLVSTVATNSYVFEHIEAARMYFPTFELARMINIANFLERIDPVILITWVAGTFIKISVFFYFIVINIASLFGLKDYRPVVLPTGIIITVLAIIEFKSSMEIRSFLAETWPFLAITFELVIPLLVLSIVLIRGQGQKKLREDN